MAFCLARPSASNSKPARMAMMAVTTVQEKRRHVTAVQSGATSWTLSYFGTGMGNIDATPQPMHLRRRSAKVPVQLPGRPAKKQQVLGSPRQRLKDVEGVGERR